MLRAVCTLAAPAAAIPYPGVAVSPCSSGSQGVILLHTDEKPQEGFPLPDPAPKLPWPRWICSLASGSTPGFKQRQGSCLSSAVGPALLILVSSLSAFPYLNSFLPSSAFPLYRHLPAILFPSPAKPPLGGAAPFTAFCLKPHISQASAFLRALDIKKLQFWSLMGKCNCDINTVALGKNPLQMWAALDPSQFEWLHVPQESLAQKYTAFCVQSRALSLANQWDWLKNNDVLKQSKMHFGQLSSAPWLWSGFQFGPGDHFNPISKFFSVPWRARHLLEEIKSNLRLPETPQKYWCF